MANDKEIIKKLVALADKQQKIITKLAQAAQPLAGGGGSSSSWDDVSASVTPVVQQAAKAVGAKAQYGVQSAELGKESGALRVKLQYPMAQLGSPEAKAVTEKTKAMLTGKPLNGVAVNTVEVIGVTV
jgi:hypothetical protein